VQEKKREKEEQQERQTLSAASWPSLARGVEGRTLLFPLFLVLLLPSKTKSIEMKGATNGGPFLPPSLPA